MTNIILTMDELEGGELGQESALHRYSYSAKYPHIVKFIFKLIISVYDDSLILIMWRQDLTNS